MAIARAAFRGAPRKLLVGILDTAKSAEKRGRRGLA
jgi:hypothetical protein